MPTSRISLLPSHLMRPFVTLAGCVAALLAASVDLSAQGSGFTCPADRVQRPLRTNARDSLASLTVDSIRDELRRAAITVGGPALDGVVLVDEPLRGQFRVRMHRANLAPEAVEAIRAAAAAARPRWPRRSGDFGLMVRFDAADPEGAAERQRNAVECRPDLVNREAVTTIFETWSQRNYASAPARHSGYVRAMVRALVTRDGEVVFPEVTQRSGWRLFDDAAPALAAAMRLDPARIGERPVDVWIVLPVRIALELPRRPTQPTFHDVP